MKTVLGIIGTIGLALFLCGCSVIEFQTDEFYNNRMREAVPSAVFVNFEIKNSAFLTEDTKNSVQSKLVLLKKYKFASVYNEGGHQVLRTLSDTGHWEPQKKEIKTCKSDYKLQLDFYVQENEESTGSLTVKNIVYRGKSSFHFFRGETEIASGIGKASRGITRRSNFSRIEAGQSKDGQANKNDMIQISFNRILSEIFNVIPIYSKVAGILGDEININSGKQDGFLEGLPVVVLEKNGDVFHPVAKGHVRSAAQHNSMIIVDGWINSTARKKISDDVRFLKKNPNSLFVLTENVGKEFFNK